MKWSDTSKAVCQKKWYGMRKNKNKMKISVTAGICILILRCVPVKEAKRWLICSSALSSDCSDYSSLTFYLRVWVQSWGKFKPLILHRDLNQAYVYQHLLILLKCWSREPWLHSVRADSSTEIAPVHRRRGTFLKNLGLFLPLKITRSHSKFALARKSPLHLSHRGVYCWKVFSFSPLFGARLVFIQLYLLWTAWFIQFRRADSEEFLR